MAATLEFYPLPTQTFPLTGHDYTIRNIRRYLQNPVDVTLEAEGFGGLEARIIGNNLIISQTGVLADQPYVVLTATRGNEVVKRTMDLIFAGGFDGVLEQPSAAEQPSEASQPSAAEQPSTAEQPSAAAQPNEPVPPDDPEQPSEAAQPSEALQPSAALQPEEPVQPDDPEQPSEASQPSEALQPSAVVNPDPPEDPSEASQPSEALQPSSSSTECTTAAE